MITGLKGQRHPLNRTFKSIRGEALCFNLDRDLGLFPNVKIVIAPLFLNQLERVSLLFGNTVKLPLGHWVLSVHEKTSNTSILLLGGIQEVH